MSPLWNRYVFRRGLAVQELWDDLFGPQETSPIFIVGGGFDLRAKAVLDRFLRSAKTGAYLFRDATLLLIEYSGYDLDSTLQQQTADNCGALRDLFSPFGRVITLPIKLSGGDEYRTTSALRDVGQSLGPHLAGHTDIILDVSSLPRVVFLTLMTNILARLIPNIAAENARASSGVNFQILVAEDSALDATILSEDPSENLVTIPGFGGGFNVESMNDWPVVWFPMLGEGRTMQFEKVRRHAPIPDDAEICPVLPHPSRDPRRGDMLLLEYRRQLFDVQAIPMSNIVYAHESNPFEAYRQLRNALGRYRHTLEILGGSRLLVTPLASKLMTVACGLACFEIRPPIGRDDYAIGIPYAVPTRYAAPIEALRVSKPEVSALLLTGKAYET